MLFVVVIVVVFFRERGLEGMDRLLFGWVFLSCNFSHSAVKSQ